MPVKRASLLSKGSNTMTDKAYSGTIPVPPNTISNVNYIGVDGGGFQKINVPLWVVAKTLFESMNGWPCRVGANLFVDEGGGLRYLPSSEALFSWMKEKVDVCWENFEAIDAITFHPVAPVTQKEFYIYLQHHAMEYLALETVPHWPIIEKPPIYYMDIDLPPPDMTAIKEFSDHFNADSEEDRFLACAAAITPGWGGPAGCRPAFIFTSEHGYGVGKTETAKLICSLWGGAVELNEKDSWDKIQRAMMNDDIIGRRCMLLDNLKSHMNHGGLESLITSSDVSGHVMYHGYRKRPNFYTVFMTANTPQLSRDLIDRCVMIRLGKHQHNADWKEWAIYFHQERRDQFVSDALGLLMGEGKCEIPHHQLDRWATWETNVLSKFASGPQMLQHIKKVRNSCDSELKMAQSIAYTICNMIVNKGFADPETVCLKLSKSEVSDALKEEGLMRKYLSDVEIEKRVMRLHDQNLAPLRPLSQEDGTWVWKGPAYIEGGPSVS